MNATFNFAVMYRLQSTLDYFTAYVNEMKEKKTRDRGKKRQYSCVITFVSEIIVDNSIIWVEVILFCNSLDDATMKLIK